MTDILPDPGQGVEDVDDTDAPLPHPDGESEREGGGVDEGLEGLRNLT